MNPPTPPAAGAGASELEAPVLTPAAARILEVAAGLFYRHGIHAVGVDRIAAESGVTKRTLYDRFGSKDALVVAYLRTRHQTWWGRLQQRLQDADQAGASRLLAVFDAYAHDPLPTDRGCAFLNAAAEFGPDHPVLRVVRAHKLAVRELLVDLLRAGSPDVDDPEATAAHLFLLLEGAVSQRAVDSDGGDALHRRAREIAERLTQA